MRGVAVHCYAERTGGHCRAARVGETRLVFRWLETIGQTVSFPPATGGFRHPQCCRWLQYPPILGYIAGMPNDATLERLAAIAEDQWGLVTRRQVEAAGVPETTLERLTKPGSTLERVARGVYRLIGSPPTDHIQLRAAWLQLAPGLNAQDRTDDQGVVSHRSAAALYGLGHLAADQHEFITASRRQSRRPDIRLHRRNVRSGEVVRLHGLPVTRPSSIAADLLAVREEPEAVAQIVADAIRGIYDYPGTFADSLAPRAADFGLRRNDGLAVLRWLLDLVGDQDTSRWIEEARAHVSRATVEPGSDNLSISHPPNSAA